MANHRGTEGVVQVGSNAMAETREWEIEEEATTIDDTLLGDEWDTHQLGRKRWSMSLKAFWDETDTNGQVAIPIGTTATFNVYPEGTSSTDVYYSGAGTVTKINRRANRESMVEIDFEMTGNGALSTAAVGA
jgi:hypothetical protein